MKIDLYSEEEILKACKKGKRVYQEILYRKYAKKMYGICLSYVSERELAQDVLQESFIKIFEKIKEFKSEGSLEGWIRRIVTNTSIDYLRGKKRIQNYISDSVDINEGLSEAEGYINLKTQDILEQVSKLPDGARVVFNLYALEGYTHKEIAKKLNITEGTSKSQFSRARKLLMTWLDKIKCIGKMDFLKWYKNRVESSELEPPEEVWGNIQDELDINQSWQFIDNHLAEKAAYRRRYYLAIAASILVIFSVGSYWFLNSPEEQGELQSMVDDVNKAENKILEEKRSTINNLLTEEIPQLQIESKETQDPKVLLAENIIKPFEQLTENEEVENRVIVEEIEKMESRIVLVEHGLNDEIMITNLNENNSEKRERLAFKKMYMGTTGQLANTWMLNEKTYNGFDSYSLTTSNASFGSNFGLFVGTNLLRNVDLQLDINILAQNKQEYKEYVSGHYISNIMKFNYSQTALSVRYNYLSKRFLPGTHGINLGSYLGYLHNAYQIIDGEVISLTDNYTSFDFGLFVAYEYIIPISRRIGFGTGVKAYYGLQNIYAGDEYIPSYMNNTNNASLNISFSLKYDLK